MDENEKKLRDLIDGVNSTLDSLRVDLKAIRKELSGSYRTERISLAKTRYRVENYTGGGVVAGVYANEQDAYDAAVRLAERSRPGNEYRVIQMTPLVRVMST